MTSLRYLALSPSPSPRSSCWCGWRRGDETRRRYRGSIRLFEPEPTPGWHPAGTRVYWTGGNRVRIWEGEAL